MIKPNKVQEQSILRSGYRNQLKKNSQNSESHKGSQANRSDFEDGIKSTVSKQTKKANQNKSQSSQRSRNTSAQRALNTSFGSHPNPIPAPSHTNQVQFQQQSLVRQTYPIIASSQYHYKRPTIQRHPSQPIAALNHSQASDVNTQIQTLNRLREQHEIIKQVTSDDEIKESENNDRSGFKQIKGDFWKRKYVNESRESVPARIVRNKTLGVRLVTGVNRSHVSNNRNPEMQAEDDKYSVGSDKQDKPNNPNMNRRKQLKQSDNTQTKSKQQTIASSFNNNRQYLVQISTLQSALTQSSIKIQQLLMQSIKSKQKLRQHSQLMQKAHKLQNELKMKKQTERYLKRQIEMKDEQIQRFQKRTKLMKQTMEMMEKESQMKEKELGALQGLLLGSRVGDLKNYGQNYSGQNYLGQNYSEQMEKIRELAKEKERMRAELQSEMRNKQLQRWRGKQQYLVGNQQQSIQIVKQRLKQTQQKLNQVQSLNMKLSLQLQGQKQRNAQYLEQTISSRVKYELAHSSVSGAQQKFNINIRQSQMGKQIESIRQQLSKLQAFTNQNLKVSNQENLQAFTKEDQVSYVNELQTKLKSLQQVMKVQNQQKVRFVKQIQRIRQQQKQNAQKLAYYTREIGQLRQQNHSIKKQNEISKTQVSVLKSYNSSLTKLQSQITVNCVPTELYTQLEREKNQLTYQLNTLQREMNTLQSENNSLKHKLGSNISHDKTITYQEKQQLLRNLDEIKHQYLKLEEGYFEKAKECQQVRLELFSKNSRQVQHLQSEIQSLQQQLQSERHYVQQLQQKVHEKEFRLVEFLNLAQNTTTYNEKIRQLHQHLSTLQIRLKQKDFQTSQLLIEHKKQLNHQKHSLNQLHLQLSQKTLQLISLKNSLQQQRKLHEQEKQNYLKQLGIKKQQLQQLQKHYQSLVKMDKQMGLEQVKLLETQIFDLVRQKQTLLEETMKMSQLEYEIKNLLMKQKTNRKISQSIDHLWMIKEAEYFNLNQILNLVNFQPSEKQSNKGSQNYPITITEHY